jgi:hypothetical protein
MWLVRYRDVVFSEAFSAGPHAGQSFGEFLVMPLSPVARLESLRLSSTTRQLRRANARDIADPIAAILF